MAWGQGIQGSVPFHPYPILLQVFPNSLRITSLAATYQLSPVESHPYEKPRGATPPPFPLRDFVAALPHREAARPVIPNPRVFCGVRDLLFGFHAGLIADISKATSISATHA